MTHPKLESLSVAEIDSEFQQSIAAVKTRLGVSTKYFRAPYGTDGALTRQRFDAAVGGGSKVINWVSISFHRSITPPPPGDTMLIASAEYRYRRLALR
jgi:peptidoglycan/xylan/chitin deacetylase (PgdA/CDA1 family)